MNTDIDINSRFKKKKKEKKSTQLQSEVTTLKTGEEPSPADSVMKQ